MSEAKAQSRARAVNYLARLLQMNPGHEADEIIRLRTAALGLAARSEAAPAKQQGPPREERQKLLEQLEQIRGEFWTMPLAALQAQLAALAAQDLPDIKAAADRLRTVAACRSEFPRLAGDRRFDGEFFSALKQILIRSPRDTALAKEQVLSSFRNRARRKKGRSMVQLLKSELPAVYELEAEWFEALRRQKAKPREILVSAAGRAPVESGWSGNGWLLWVLLFIAIRVIMSLTRSH